MELVFSPSGRRASHSRLLRFQSDFDRIFRAAQESAGDTGAPQRRKPGKVPTHEWPLVVAAELIRRSKAGEREPTAAEMIRYCEHTFPDQFSPGLKEMQTLLRKLLFGQF